MTKRKRDPRLTDLEELLRLAPRTGVVLWDQFKRLHGTWTERDDAARKGFERLRNFALTIAVELVKSRVDDQSFVSFDPEQLGAAVPPAPSRSRPTKTAPEDVSLVKFTGAYVCVLVLHVEPIAIEVIECKANP